MNALAFMLFVASQAFRPGVAPGAAGVGDVMGPGSSTDNAVARFDGTTGKVIQNSVVTIGDTGAVAGVSTLTMSGVLAVNSGDVTTTDLSPSLFDTNATSATILAAATGAIDIAGGSVSTGCTVTGNTGAFACAAALNGSALNSTTFLQAGEIATPSTPASGFGRFYFKSDGKAYALNDAGVETDLQATSSGTIGGTIASTQVAVGSGADTIAGSSLLTFTSSTISTLAVSSAANSSFITSTGNLNTGRAAIELTNNENSNAFAIYSWGSTGNGSTIMGLASANVTTATTNKGLYWASSAPSLTTGMVIGTENDNPFALRTNSVERMSVSGAGVTVFNPGALATGDLRWAGDNRTHGLFCDADAGVASHLGRCGINRSSLGTTNDTATFQVDNGGSGEYIFVGYANGTEAFRVGAAGQTVIQPQANDTGLLIANTATVSSAVSLDIWPRNVSATNGIMRIQYAVATTQTGAISGQITDLSTNLTPAVNQDQVGHLILLDTVSFASGTTTHQGYAVAAAGGLTTTSTGALTWNGYGADLPNLTQTAGVLAANGTRTTNGSITTGGTASHHLINATGVGAGSLFGVNIQSITGGAGAETAIKIGSGWDTGIQLDDVDVVLSATTGTKFGTATSQKLSFFNATPVVQQAAIADPTGGAIQDAECRAAVTDVITRLETFGFIAL